MSRSTVKVAAVAAVLMLVLGAGPAPAARISPEGAPEPVEMEISGRTYRYFPLSVGAPLAFTIEGPAVFRPILRPRLPEDAGAVSVEVELLLDGVAQWRRVFRSGKGRASYPAQPEWRAGEATRLSLDVPSGSHRVELLLVVPDEGVVDVNPVVGPPDVLPWRAEWRLEAGAAYDSNIFRYADADVDDFIDGVESERYAADYVDEFRLEPGVDLTLVREEPAKRLTEFRLSADWRLATVNGEKSFGRLGTRVKETRPGVAYFLAEYYAIPAYHVRWLYDGDVPWGSPYRSCDLRKHAMRLEMGSDRSLPVDVAARWKYEYSGYDQDFVEYDSDAWSLGVVTTMRPARGVRVDLGYAFRTLVARGYDEVWETRDTSDDSDTSYEQDEYSARVRWDVGKVQGFPTVLTLSGKMADRFYQSEKSGEDDPYHAGREDRYWTFAVRTALELREGLALESFYEHRRRTAQSPFLSDIGDSKDYTAHRVGLRLIFEGERILD